MDWKHYKVFVSSTFKDMDIERDVLKNVVEPHINEVLAAELCSMEFVDLRHCVKTDLAMSADDRERQIFNTCIDEIDNCEPFFIGLLGHRYGWIPGSELIEGQTISVPASFPIVAEKLSVTAYEFLHGIFAQHAKPRCRVFLRNMDSYANLSAEERLAYVDTNDVEKSGINRLRDYVTYVGANYVRRYTLDVSKGVIGASIDCIKMFEDEILKMIREGHRLPSNPAAAISDYALEHERIVQYHLKRFKGRERELEECQRKLETRNFCILTATEYGIGRTAFLCKMYDHYRSIRNNVCLIYLKNTPSDYTVEDGIRYWNIELDKRLDAKMHDAITSAGDDLAKQKDILRQLAEKLKDQGLKLFLFIDTYIQDRDLLVGDYLMLSAIVEDNNYHGLRPLMYILNPLSSHAKHHILHRLRPRVADIILSNPSSDNIRWLSKACDIMQTMMKYDFLRIRNIRDDNEAAITSYQCEMAESLPASYAELTTFWIDRVCHMAGTQTVHDYLFLMAMSPEGWTDNVVCNILSCSHLEISMIRQMLGADVVTKTVDGRYILTDYDNITSWLHTQTLHEHKDLLTRAHRAVMQEHTPLYDQKRFLLSLLAEQYDDCVQMIRSGGIEGAADYNDAIRFSLIWLGTNYNYDFNRLTRKLLGKDYLTDETFAQRIVVTSKQIGMSLDPDTYDMWLSTALGNLRQLKLENKISEDHYLNACELLACTFDYYNSRSEWEKAGKAVIEGLAATMELAMTNAGYQKYYVYFVFRYLGFIPDTDKKAACIDNRFVKMMDCSDIAFRSNIDTTVHSLLFIKAAELYASRGDIERATVFAKKAIQLGMRLVRQKKAGEAETFLDLRSVKRNLLNDLERVQVLHADYGVIDTVFMSQLFVNAITMCGDVAVGATRGDRIYYLYYATMARHILCEYSDVMERVERLSELCYQLVQSNGLNTIEFHVFERQENTMSWPFKAWLFVSATMLHEWSQLDVFEMPVPERCRKFLEHELKCADHDVMSFDSIVDMLLPVIGSKMSLAIDMSDPFSTIAEQLFLLYTALLRRESKREAGADAQRIVSLFNSACETYADLHMSEFSEREACRAELQELKWMYETACEKCGDTIDQDRTFGEFNDCYGISGDYYVSADGMWENGDPELMNQIQMTTDGKNLSSPRSVLEGLIDSEKYAAVITRIGKKEKMGFSEIYYLALAYLRTDQYIKALNTIAVILQTEKFPAGITYADIYASETLYLTACLLGHEFGRFEHFIDSCDEQELADPEIRVLADAYTTYKKNADNREDIRLPKPYGRKL